MSTAELAERFEVSRRTVLRDVEALSAAGVPVYAERGRNGGIVLLPGARLNASHLEPAELEALSVAGLDSGQLERMGLAGVWESAARKMAARQGPPREPASPPLADLVLVESTAWFAASPATVDVADLASVLRRRRRLRIRYRRSAEAYDSARVIDPYGLVAKAGRWYLVADDCAESRLFALERVSGFEELDAPAVLRPGETLRTLWETLKQRTERQDRVSVTLRLPASSLDLARRILGNRIHEVSEGPDGWCLVVRYPELESVRQLLQFGDHLDVLSPPAARRRVAELARALLDQHTVDAT